MTQKHSNTYLAFIKYMNATGMDKAYGAYPSDVFSKIFDWEREGLEDIIYQRFISGMDPELARYMPELEKYNGINALKKVLATCEYKEAAFVLYEATGDESYLDVIDKIIHEKGMNNADLLSIVSQLGYVKPCKRTFEILADVFAESENDNVQFSALTGILVHMGLIVDRYDAAEIRNPEVQEMIKKLEADDSAARRRNVEEVIPEVMAWLNKSDNEIYRIEISDYAGNQSEGFISVKKVMTWIREENVSYCGIEAISAVGSYLSPRKSKMIAWYADMASADKELQEIKEAMREKKDSYDLKYFSLEASKKADEYLNRPR